MGKLALRAPFLVFALGGCVVPPTPSLIANCRTSSILDTRPAPKVRSIAFDFNRDHSGFCVFCDLLRKWRLDFVEFPASGQNGVFDRARLLPAGDPRCTPRQRGRAVSRLPVWSAPRGSCIAAALDQPRSAELLVTLAVEPMGDHGSELIQATPASGGPPVVRVRDFTIRAADAGPALCAKVLRGFPANTLGYVIDRVAERR